ncbi:MAG: acyltransferase [Oscillospiraceae bacterium]
MVFWINVRKAINMFAYRWYTPFNKLKFKLNGVKYGSGLKVRGSVYVFKHYASAELLIGNNVLINSAPWANPIGTGDRTYFQMLQNSRIVIGNKCGISNCSFTCATEIVLEDNVLLGSGCKIYDTDFHPLDYNERIKGNSSESPIKAKPVRIKEGAFIGAGSFVLKGVTIGKHSIVGAGSVVTKSIPDGEIWAGNPAVFIRKIDEL